jgi:hypothetical protein
LLCCRHLFQNVYTAKKISTLPICHDRYSGGIAFSGDDWEHEETFTDDDEAVDIDPEERADLAPEIPAPPEIKQVVQIYTIC